MDRPRYSPIRDYGIIGDLHSAALVDRLGSIDWFCAPRFDSPAIFARLLDADKGGSMRVVPEDDYISDSRRYLPGTNILETGLSSAQGRLMITDFMVAKEQLHQHDDDHILVRQLEAPDGKLQVKVVVDARFDYGRQEPEVELRSDSGCLVLKHDALHLHFDGPGVWEREGRCLVQHLELSPGEPQSVLLRYDGTKSHHRDYDPQKLLQVTQRFWEDWIKRCEYDGPYLDLVFRSALVLKLLIYAPEGSIVAAPTSSLPEWIGGQRNWDYRYTWLRDSAFLLYALQLLGYHEEAANFISWLERVHKHNPNHFQIMYGIDGRTDVAETELSGLDGYQGSRPVRIGNGAADQKQLDIYGEVVDSAYLHLRYGKIKVAPMHSTLVAMVDQAMNEWKEPDNGIWEMRGGPQHFVYSKLLCWVALDRGISLSRELKVDKRRREKWVWAREEIRHTILTRGWSDKLGSFRQVLDEDQLDATSLMIPLLRFLSPLDPRMRQTIQTIQRDLTDQNGFVYRYRRDDGLGASEGTFLLCSFWLVDNLALQGQIVPARDLFERLTSHGNDLGLFSEELDPDSGELLGNFPQAFTHLAIVNAAAHLERAAENRGPLARASS
ncbi:MAG TPA: glycoside hydrolase family 15 protein [Candidatus Dormibacteraeota bacterium]|nr:glycoside hydrolase family 15 protein [Candidatus Dormibacteraeota bacterium]